MIKVTCFGAAGTVTGSNFLVETAHGKKVLIDCGLFQGGRETEAHNWENWGYDPKEIKNLILTHAHIDHSGRIPKLVKDGFRGKIITSPPTAELCGVMLLDSAHIQEMEAEWQTRKNRRRGKKDIEPLYTTEDAEQSLRYFSPQERDHIIDIEPGIKAQFRNAGHILGASSVELWVEEEGTTTKIVFSGDLGKYDQLIVKDPFKVTEADYLFIESTYGNRLHRIFEESKAELLEAINYAVSHLPLRGLRKSSICSVNFLVRDSSPISPSTLTAPSLLRRPRSFARIKSTTIKLHGLLWRMALTPSICLTSVSRRLPMNP
jgi:metallo-beta-lactamase family protein